MQKAQLVATALGFATAVLFAREQRQITNRLRTIEASFGMAVEHLVDINDATQTIVARLGPPPGHAMRDADADAEDDADDAPIIPLQQDPQTARPHTPYPEKRRIANDWARFP